MKPRARGEFPDFVPDANTMWDMITTLRPEPNLPAFLPGRMSTDDALELLRYAYMMGYNECQEKIIYALKDVSDRFREGYPFNEEIPR